MLTFSFPIRSSTQTLSAVPDRSAQDLRLVGSWAAANPDADTFVIEHDPILSPIAINTANRENQNAEAVGVLRASLHREVPEDQSESTWYAIRLFGRAEWFRIHWSIKSVMLDHYHIGTMHKIYRRLRKMSFTIILFDFPCFHFIFSVQHDHLIHRLCRLINELRFTIHLSQKPLPV